jgi:RNA polymerase sigma-70 factor (ECF subfamily)
VAAVALSCGSRPAAEDAVQEALLRAWERSEKGEDIGSMNAWVTTVALNLARSGVRRLRSERRAKARLRGSAWADDHAPVAERAVDVERALARLPVVSAKPSSSATSSRRTHAVVAAALNVNEGTVKSTPFRAAPPRRRARSRG